ncbi:ASN_HP2_G0016430.mRNA.1.CDS.1 [Saccharomyces cerevisiae]|nr:ASN_HP2_G0016430.mRNA.1.CDS.1 [Saccharomyces cerevisiae]CAI6528923.1 ASN_HP2_G0016430.mRNA.1.CDS.1 [Saccharomyces cerevisiae]
MTPPSIVVSIETSREKKKLYSKCGSVQEEELTEHCRTLKSQDIPIPKIASPSIPQHLRSNTRHLSSSVPIEAETFSSFQPDMNMT